MAKGEQKGNRESKKPKKEKVKTIAAAPTKRERRLVGNRTSDQARRNKHQAGRSKFTWKSMFTRFSNLLDRPKKA